MAKTEKNSVSYSMIRVILIFLLLAALVYAGIDAFDGKVINVATPTAVTDAANKAYHDAVGNIPDHSLLSTQHSDTLAATVSRGSLVAGNSTPKWSELVIGTSGKVLFSDGVDFSWVDTNTFLDHSLTNTWLAIQGGSGFGSAYGSGIYGSELYGTDTDTGTNEYFHLTAAEHAELTDWGGVVTLSAEGDVNLVSGDFTTTGIISGGTITDGTASITGGAITSATNTNWDLAYVHISESGASHTYIDQSVVSGATPTFTATNITGVPAANVLAGTFGTGAYVFDNTVSGITDLTASGLGSFGNVLLSAGTADAGTGPLKFTAGTALTTPETGAIEFHDDRFYITNKSVRKALDRTGDVKTTTTTVANTTTETEVYEALVPAGSWVAGNVLKILMSGTLSNKVGSAGHTVTIKVYVGTDEVSAVTSTAAKFTDVCWHISGCAIVRDVGVTGHMAYHIDMVIDGDNGTVTCDVVEINTTGALDITVTATWASDDAANIFTCDMGIMEYKN